MKDDFSAREVAVLVKELKSEFRTVAEGVVSLLPLREEMVEVKERLSAVENRLIVCEDAVRIGMPDLYKRVTRLESKVGI